MMWERCRELVDRAGHARSCSTRTVTRIRHDDGRRRRGRRRRPTARRTRYPCTARDLVDADRRAAARRWTRRSPTDVRRPRPTTCATATSSPSRSSCPRSTAFPDNWIYIHDPEVQGRPHPELRLVVAVHGEGGPHLPRPRVLRERGRRDVDEARRRPHRAGQARARSSSAWSTRRRSRPATSCGCRRRIRSTTSTTRRNVDDAARVARGEHARTCIPVGRNGMHQYNNQDHSMFTAMLTVENILGADHDVWAVNVEEEYHEETRRRRATNGATGRDAPVLPRRALDDAAARSGRGVEGGCRRPVSRRSPGPTRPHVRTRRIPVRCGRTIRAWRVCARSA